MKYTIRMLAALVAALVLCAALPAAGLGEAEPAQDIVPEIEEYILGDAGNDLGALTGACNDPAPEEKPAEEGADVLNDDAFSVDSDGRLYGYRGAGGSVVIPNSVTSIGGRVFANNSSITSVYIPDGVTSIGDEAFEFCSKLAEVRFPSTLTAIGESAFCGCGLTQVAVPYGVSAIEDFTFGLCDSLKSVTLPATVSHIDYDAFWDCPKLASVTIEAMKTQFDEKAFEDSNPVFYVVRGSDACNWANRKGFRVVETGLLLEGDTACDAKVGATIQIRLNGAVAVSYTSSDTGVATVTSGGLVTALKGGTARITVVTTAGTGMTLTLNVTDGAALSASALNLVIGESATLTVNDLAGRGVTWSTSNAKVAAVKNGKVTGKLAGKCTITAKIAGGKALTCKVTVKDGAALSAKAQKLEMGKAFTLKISGLAKRKVTWTTSNAKVATVKKGKVVAKSAGKCTITAKVKNGKTLKCKVTVTDPARLSETSLAITSVDSARLSVSGLLKRKVEWSSSNASVASVNNGVVTGRKAGQCTITAKVAGGKALKCKVSVYNPLSIRVDSIHDTSIYNELEVTIQNNSNKKIIYVEMDILQYNNRGDRLQSPYSYFYLNETIMPHDRLYWEYWVHDDTKRVAIYIREITFGDGSKWRP